MDGFIAAVALVALLVALGIAAALWGVDSRPGFADDHNR
jgi:hypothetical protein